MRTRGDADTPSVSGPSAVTGATQTGREDGLWAVEPSAETFTGSAAAEHRDPEGRARPPQSAVSSPKIWGTGGPRRGDCEVVGVAQTRSLSELGSQYPLHPPRLTGCPPWVPCRPASPTLCSDLQASLREPPVAHPGRSVLRPPQPEDPVSRSDLDPEA